MLISFYGCKLTPDCRVSTLSTIVQEKNVSVNISIELIADLVQFNWLFSDGFSQATTVHFVEHEFIENGAHSLEVEV
jgi:hypothetical protein